MGVVYRATDTRLDRDVALKVLPADLVADPERKQRFMQEARAASVLGHPNLAVIHDVGDEDGISFIAMELVRGGKLSAAIDAKTLTTARVLDVAAEIAESAFAKRGDGIDSGGATGRPDGGRQAGGDKHNDGQAERCEIVRRKSEEK
jgi:eukaryotic-like serine/threonine-protein kinase